MEELVRINVLYLDNLLQQYLNYRRYKGGQNREYITKIKKRLKEQVEMVYKMISDQVTVQPTHAFGEKHFNNRAIKSDFEMDWRLLRQLKNFELLRDRILSELIPKPPENLFRRENSKFSSSILKRYEKYFDSLKSKDDKDNDEDEVNLPKRFQDTVFELDEEYFMDDKCNLPYTALVVDRLGQLQPDI